MSDSAKLGLVESHDGGHTWSLTAAAERRYGQALRDLDLLLVAEAEAA